MINHCVLLSGMNRYHFSQRYRCRYRELGDIVAHYGISVTSLTAKQTKTRQNCHIHTVNTQTVLPHILQVLVEYSIPGTGFGIGAS